MLARERATEPDEWSPSSELIRPVEPAGTSSDTRLMPKATEAIIAIALARKRGLRKRLLASCLAGCPVTGAWGLRRGCLLGVTGLLRHLRVR
jgi:hypothetical protein